MPGASPGNNVSQHLQKTDSFQEIGKMATDPVSYTVADDDETEYGRVFKGQSRSSVRIGKVRRKIQAGM